MAGTSPVYDTIGRQYRNCRNPDPRIAAQINRALGNARTVCNVGAGTGSYEPSDREVVAVEPSSIMITQRTSPQRVIKAYAESLPFPDGSFDAAMAILTTHHWNDPVKGLAELRRISRRQLVLTFDTARQMDHWLVRDYLPEIAELEATRALPIEQIKECLQAQSVECVPIPCDCTDGFQAAYWRRPAEYLNPEVQATISTLAQLPPEIVSRAMDRLARDLASGEWATRHTELLSREEMDFGYRLIIADKQTTH
jgi:SAM-dependent methyltransferase